MSDRTVNDQTVSAAVDPTGGDAGRSLRHSVRWARRVVVWASFAVVMTLVLALVVVPKVTGAVPLTVRSGSMEPAIATGSIVVVRPVDVATIEVGDVITYQLRSGESVLVTHRVVGVDTGDGIAFRTQGDANGAADAAPVQAGQVMGEVWYQVPWVGHLVGDLDGSDRQLLVRIVAALLIAYGAWLVTLDVVARKRRRRDSGAAVVGVVTLGLVAGAVGVIWAVGAGRPVDAAGALQISADGRQWATDYDGDLFAPGTRLAPGGSATAHVYVRNAASGTGHLQVELADVASEAALAGLVLDAHVRDGAALVDHGRHAVAGALVVPQPLGSGHDLRPGEQRRLDVTLGLPSDAPNIAQDRSLAFTIRVSLGSEQVDIPIVRQPERPEQPERPGRVAPADLGATGADSVSWLIAASLLVGVGTALARSGRSSRAGRSTLGVDVSGS